MRDQTIHTLVMCVLVAHTLIVPVLDVCLFITHVHSLCAPSSHMRDSSMCNLVCHRYDNPTNAPIGNPSMARLP